MSVTLSLVDGKYIIGGNSYPVKDALKGAGFRWDMGNKHWWTDSVQVVISCAVSFVCTDEVLVRRLMEAKGEMLSAIESSSAMDAWVEVPSAKMELEYRGYQLAGISYILGAMDRGLGGVVLGDEMGTGKTVQGCGVLNKLIEDRGSVDAVVVCPASLKYVWSKHLQDWLCGSGVIKVALDGKGKSDDIEFCNVEASVGYGRGTGSTVLVVNYELISRGVWADLAMAMQSDLVIVDEAHKIKNPKARRTQAVLALDGFKVFMTGTPMPNRVREMWGILNACDPSVFGDEKKFLFRYCGPRQVSGGRGRLFWQFDGASNTEELARKMRSSCMIRRLKSEVLAELPDKSREVVQLSTGRSYSGEFQHAETHEIEAWFDQSRAGINFSELSTMRRYLGELKVDACINYIQDQVEDHPVVVFAHHKSVIEKLASAFEGDCVVVDGSVNALERSMAVEKFQHAEGPRVFIGSIKACAEGLTLTRSSHVIFVEFDWVPASMAQAEDRCHRIGQKDSVRVTYLSDGGLDGRIMGIISEKSRMISATVDSLGDSSLRNNRVELAQVEEEQSLELSEFTVASELSEEARAEQEEEKFQRRYDGMAKEQAQALWDACKMLAGVCDGACAEDGQGFNGRDARFGHSIASQDFFPSPKQIAVLSRMLKKYKRQIPADLYELCGYGK